MEYWDSEIKEMVEGNSFGKCEDTLKLLAEKRIFSIYFHKGKDKYVMVERCDGYFGTELTYEMCKDLSELFSKIVDEIKEK